MSILSIDTSTKSGSISIWLSPEKSVDWIGDPSISHGERLPNDIARVLERGNIELTDVELFGVGIGPGSFTGLRVGISTVQALAVGQQRQVVPVPTLDAVAAVEINQRADEVSRALNLDVAEENRYTVVWMDGQRGHVFAGLYLPGPLVSGVVRPKCVLGPMVGYPAKVLDAMSDALGSFGQSVMLSVVGTAADRDKDMLEFRLRGLAGDLSIVSGEFALAPVMGRLVAARQYDAVGPDGVQPLYVRSPDAVLARDRQFGRS